MERHNELIFESSEEIQAMEEEDHISKLPDEIIHHILSFLGANYAVQTSVLSPRWKYIWTSLPRINFDTSFLPAANMKFFSKFVTHFLTRRDKSSNITTLNFVRPESLSLTDSGSLRLVEKIGEYAISHNIQKLNIVSHFRRKFPLPAFNSPFLTDFTLNALDEVALCDLSWNLPALTTLHLQGIEFRYEDDEGDKSVDPFSQFGNLKNLTLNRCSMGRLKIFNIINPRLESLTMIETKRKCTMFPVSAPKLSSFTYQGRFSLWLTSIDGFPHLEKVNLMMQGECKGLEREKNRKEKKVDDGGFMVWKALEREQKQKEKMVDGIMDMLSQLSNATFLSLSYETVVLFTEIIDLLKYHASPFINLKHLNINLKREDSSDSSSQVKNVVAYFIDGSPTAALFIKKNS